MSTILYYGTRIAIAFVDYLADKQRALMNSDVDVPFMSKAPTYTQVSGVNNILNLYSCRCRLPLTPS